MKLRLVKYEIPVEYIDGDFRQTFNPNEAVEVADLRQATAIVELGLCEVVADEPEANGKKK